MLVPKSRRISTGTILTLSPSPTTATWVPLWSKIRVSAGSTTSGLVRGISSVM